MLHARVHFCTLKVLKVKHKGYHHDRISYLQLPFAKELFCPINYKHKRDDLCLFKKYSSHLCLTFTCANFKISAQARKVKEEIQHR